MSSCQDFEFITIMNFVCRRLNRMRGASCPSDAMFPIDPLWIYVGVPAALVSILVLIKLRQEKRNKSVASSFTVEKEEEEAAEVRHDERGAIEESPVEVEETTAEPQPSQEGKPQDCPHYLGYLYMRKASEKTHIPSECYNCRKLLQCLYSPNIIQKVYGE